MKRLCLSLLLMTLSACVTPLLPDCTRFGRDGQVCLLPPSALPKLDVTHIVTVARDGKPDSFLGQLHIDAQTLRLAGSSLFGTGLLSLSYDGKTLQVEPESPQLPAGKLVVILELALADPAEIKPRLHGLDLTVSDGPQGQVRDILERGRPIVHIVRGTGPLSVAPLSIDIPPLKISVVMKPLSDSP